MVSLRRGLEILVSLAVVVLILLTAADVVGRYLLNAPIPGAFEYVRALMGIIVFAGLPLATARNEHLRAGMLEHLIPSSVNRLREPAIHTASTVALAVMTWRLAAEARTKWVSRETLSGVDIQLWWLIAFMLVMAACATVVSAALTVSPWTRRS